MSTQLSPGQEPIQDPPHMQPDDDIVLVVPSAFEQPPQLQGSDNIQEHLNDVEVESGVSAQFVRPFQLSMGMPVLQTQQQVRKKQISPPAASKKATPIRHRSFKVAIAGSLVVAALGILWLIVFAQPAQPLLTHRGGPPVTNQPTQPTAIIQKTPTASPTPKTTPPTTTNSQGGDWVPQQLPAGWTAAGLTTGDALFAERTAWSFTDLEEGLDFRNAGTRVDHGGTFTASVPLLSPGGKMRYFHNDVRQINNTLFDHVQQVNLIQAAINPVPHLVRFLKQGQDTFTWVDISFQLYQSQLSPATGKRTEGLEIDPATKQPRLHRMSVLLVRGSTETRPDGAPMSSTGWFVSSYDLDLQNGILTPLAQPV